MSVPRKIGWSLAGIHLIVVFAVAAWVLTHIHKDPTAPMLWFAVDMLDLPVFLLTAPLGPWIQSLPHVSWLPGIAGNWEAFLFSFIEDSIVGTAWWFFIGWTAGHLWTFFRRRT